MPTLILTIARITFLESVRQPIYFIMIGLCGIFQLINTSSLGFSLGYTETAEVSGDNKMLLDVGLATVLFCGTLLAGFIATAALSREIEQKTVLTVVSKPVPRPVVVLGKYFGAVAAILIATGTMILFLQVGLRHGIMSTARDDVDMPVALFSFGAVALALGVAVWGNFFYGWHFTQTASLLLFPLMFAAWILVLLISKKWEWQDPLRDFKPQIFIASISLVLALLVLTAVATAASSRLGQVMTIVVCFGVFVLGLLSNHLIAKRAFLNTPVGQVASATPERLSMESLTGVGDIYSVTLKTPPSRGLPPGTGIYYGPNPNGFDLQVPAFEPFKGNANDPEGLFLKDKPSALVVTTGNGRRLTIRNLGGTAVQVERPPQADDYVFTEPTRVNPVALAAWGVVPNMQFFWLTDAVTQNRPVPAGHLARIAIYSLVQVIGFLSLAVILFQKRDVG